MDDIAALSDKLRAGPVTLAVFLCLWERRGRTISYDTISGYASRDESDPMTEQAIRDCMKRLRPAILRAGWPVVIERAYGIGYKLTAPKEFDWRQGD